MTSKKMLGKSSSPSAAKMLFISGGAAILILSLTGQNGCLFPGVSAIGYVRTYPPHIWLGVSERAYADSLYICNLWKGNLTGQACYEHSHCKGGSLCMSKFMRRERPTVGLCCCRYQQLGECCDQKAICPGCRRPFCPDGFDPCDYDVCYRHPNATCMKDDICKECHARFFYNGTEVTDICHIVIYPSRETPTASGYMPDPDPEGDGDEEMPSGTETEEEATPMIMPSSAVLASVTPTSTMLDLTPMLARASPSLQLSPEDDV